MDTHTPQTLAVVAISRQSFRGMTLQVWDAGWNWFRPLVFSEGRVDWFRQYRVANHYALALE